MNRENLDEEHEVVAQEEDLVEEEQITSSPNPEGYSESINNLSKYNFLFYFIYKYKYENRGTAEEEVSEISID